MSRQSVIPQKKRGPKPTGKGQPIMVRLQPDQLAHLDYWAAAQFVPMSRPEAIRTLIELGLAYGLPTHPAAEKPETKKRRKA